MILHFQRSLVSMLLIFGNGVLPSPSGASTEFQIVMNHVTVVNDVKLCLAGYFPILIENGAVESNILGLPFSRTP